MACFYVEETDSYKVEVVLYIHQRYGVIGCNPFHAHGDTCFDEDSWEDEIKDAIKFSTTIMIPSALFNPYKLNISIPQEFLSEDLVASSVDSIETPVTFNGYAGNIKIEDTMKLNKSNGFMSRLKRAVVAGWNS